MHACVHLHAATYSAWDWRITTPAAPLILLPSQLCLRYTYWKEMLIGLPAAYPARCSFALTWTREPPWALWQCVRVRPGARRLWRPPWRATSGSCAQSQFTCDTLDSSGTGITHIEHGPKDHRDQCSESRNSLYAGNGRHVSAGPWWFFVPSLVVLYMKTSYFKITWYILWYQLIYRTSGSWLLQAREHSIENLKEFVQDVLDNWLSCQCLSAARCCVYAASRATDFSAVAPSFLYGVAASCLAK